MRSRCEASAGSGTSSAEDEKKPKAPVPENLKQAATEEEDTYVNVAEPDLEDAPRRAFRRKGRRELGRVAHALFS